MVQEWHRLCYVFAHFEETPSACYKCPNMHSTMFTAIILFVFMNNKQNNKLKGPFFIRCLLGARLESSEGTDTAVAEQPSAPLPHSLEHVPGARLLTPGGSVPPAAECFAAKKKWIVGMILLHINHYLQRKKTRCTIGTKCH